MIRFGWIGGNGENSCCKTLQSKPEIAEIPVLKVDDDNDVIDGGKLAVGDMADSAKRSKKSDEDSAVDNVIADAQTRKEPKGWTL